MELVQGNLEDTLTELQIGNSRECLGRVLDAQRALFHSQIDQLQKIVVTQCKLTGANPLSQEMAAGALSIKIGKRPRDLLNPKAVKYMQSIFSIKDTISKKETREISALCGVTITQVRDFFASQRSRVRKLVRLSREKAIKSNASNALTIGDSTSIDHASPVSKQTTAHLCKVEECTQVPVNGMQQLNAIQAPNLPSKESSAIDSVTESMSCPAQEETILGIDSNDQKFLENIFSLMRKEETFSGQVQLMEWILQIHNSAVLQWFLTKGGIMTLATWLSQAALEEQTTVLLVIFKVLCHLPLHKALPSQMSTILQTVNKLRFYRTSDISNKARVLLSRWSKMFVRSQALKRPFSLNFPGDTHKEITRKQRISEILSDESWFSKVDLPEDILALAYDSSENSRKLDSKTALKLLPATCNDSSKKQGRSVSCPKTKERRKVLLVEQPDHKPSGRGVQVTRTVPAKSSRPISADDIQKAKMRAIFMQRKYGKTDSPNENHFQKAVNQKISIASQANLVSFKFPNLERDEDKKPAVSATEASESTHRMFVDSKPSLTSVDLKPSFASLDSKPCLTSKGSLSEKLKNNHVTWQTPAVMRISSLWRVGMGENSKEMEVQMARIQREKETFYLSADDIPANPKDPWDMEMDFDDSLTPEIPTEPPPDADSTDVAGGEASVSPDANKDNAEEKQPGTAAAPVIAGASPDPDLELLAVLLKNPELVFALTSGRGNNLSNAETMALLDVLKKSSGGLPGMLSNGSMGTTTTTTTSQASGPPTSLPSPTPLSERMRMDWQPEPAPEVKNLQLQQHHLPGIGVATGPPAAVPPNALPSLETVAIRNTAVHPAPACVLSIPQLPEFPHPSPSRHQGAQLHHVGSPSLPHNAPPPKPEVVLHSKHLLPANGVIFPLLREETFNVEQMNGRKLPPVASVSSVPPPLATPPKVMQVPLLQEAPTHLPLLPQWPPGAAVGSKESVVPTGGSWHGRPNGLREAPAQKPRFCNGPSNINVFNAGLGLMHSVLPARMGVMDDDLLDRSELEPWSPERGPLTGPEYPSIRGGQRRGGGEYGRGDRPERSRQHNAAGNRDRYRSCRRWRDRDRRP